MRTATHAAWPELVYESWKDTYATLHMWAQVVGKVALATAPPLNHSWGVALHVTARGLSTALLRHGTRTFTVEFDFVEHRLVIRTSDGDAREIPLEPRTVAEFYERVMGALASLGIAVRVWPVAVEIPSPVRLDREVEHRSYDPDAARRFWEVLVAVAPVLNRARSSFLGKCSPVHFFWGSFDLAVTRFSGRSAPAREGPAFMREAYSHEVISHGFWPGAASLPEPVFYSYAVPEPVGLKEAAVRPAAAYYHRDLGEFILPYAAVRSAPSPEDALLAFVESTYGAAATLGQWDRRSLEGTAV